MTSEELKSALSMADVVRQYGIHIDRKGFCKCPFHNEKTASMKVYKDSFHCFGCHANGDIFSFVQRIDNCDFKTAFITLGGTYESMSDNARMVANSKRERAKNERERAEKAERQFRDDLSWCIDLCREGIKQLEPFSDLWCYFQNTLPVLLNAWEVKYEKGREIDEINVYRICREIRCKVNP